VKVYQKRRGRTGLPDPVPTCLGGLHLSAQIQSENLGPPAASVGTALGVHLGLAVVCVSAVYTIQPEGWFSTRQWLSFALVGVVLLATVAFTRGRGAATPSGKLLLALGAATALYLAYDPLLDAIPGLSALTVGFLGQFEPGLALIGVLIALLSWAVHRVLAPGANGGAGAYRGALLIATGALLVLALVMHLTLSSVYDLSAATSNLVLGFRVLQMAAILLVAGEMSGEAGVGGVAHMYVGIALIAAVARNLIV